MSAALAYMDYDGFPGRAGTAGISDESNRVRGMYKEAVSHFFEPVSKAQRLLATLDVLNELYESCGSAGWDGYDAEPVIEDSLVEAARFIFLLPSSIPMPTVSPEPTGDIAFEWYKDRQHVFAVSVGQKGVITYAGLFGSDNKTHGTEHFGDTLPPVVVDNINRLNLQVDGA